MRQRGLLQQELGLLVWEASDFKTPPRETIYWVVDLIDDYPQDAIRAIDAYTYINALFLPEGRYFALFDCISIIRARFLAVQVPDNVLDQISDRDFEHVVERLYAKMSFDTFLTPPSKDGGRDVIATRKEYGSKTKVIVDAKQWNHPVGASIASQMQGTVHRETANKGVIVTTDRFTKGARKYANDDPRLELIDRLSLVRLMNEHFGMNWPQWIDRIVAESKLLQRRR